MTYRFLIMMIMVSLSLSTVQAQHTLAGRIEFERKVNVHAQMKDYGDDNGSWYERMKSSTPQFNSTFFDLLFDTAKSIYKPGREVETQNKGYNGTGPASDNTVVTNFAQKKVTAIKNVFEQKFLVQDSIRTLQWKVKDDLRIIANYKCRKAVAIICDSVYVVAFYAEDIPVSAGPEMFGNLPGMILELAIPRLHTTWVATKIDLTPPAETDFAIPTKGKKVNRKELNETIQESLQDWGKWANKYIWWTVL